MCTKYIRFYSKDGLGNTESVQSKMVKIDKKAPINGMFKINDDAPYTTSNNVRLNTVCATDE